MIWPFILLGLATFMVILWWLIRYYGEFQTTKREEMIHAEKVLGYRAMRGWGTFKDPEREAFIEGWLDQVFKPALPAFPSSTTEATLAAYLSGWVWSRERTLIPTNPSEEPVF